MRLSSLFAFPAFAFLALPACNPAKDTDTGEGDTDTDADTDTDTDSDSDSDSQASDDLDGDGVTAEGGDCNDGNPDVYPGAPEVCDGLDNNCNAEIDEGVTTTYYRDDDGDGYGQDDATVTECSLPGGFSAEGGDCDDGDAAFHPGATEDDCSDPADYNCDGAVGAVDGDRDGFYACEECDDSNSAINPNAAELCNSVDDNCDGVTDTDAVDPATWYSDADSDGYGDDATAVAACEAPPGDIATGGDCDDSDADYNPGAAEVDCTDPNDYNCDGSSGYVDADGDGEPACTECDDSNSDVNSVATEMCDGIDNNCDGSVDEFGALGGSTFYADLDEDGYGDDADTTTACNAPDGYVAVAGDCDDLDASWHPDAPEGCSDPNDYNCDGSVGYVDADGDGAAACDDCNDADANAFPGNPELCDGIDNDCDDAVDNSAVNATILYADSDGDGFGDPSAQLDSCDESVPGFVLDASDCDDGDPAFNPSAAEACTDPIDYNCDGSTGYSDADGDGYAACVECDDSNPDVNADATEVCDGVDNNCDGTIDEAGALGELTWYADADGDGFGDGTTALVTCFPPEGYVTDDTDCDDTLSAFHPGADESDCTDPNDYNCDGSSGFADGDGDGAAACNDCDDSNPAALPGGTEVCDGADNDCNGMVDGADALDATLWYPDADSDTFGDSSIVVASCDAPDGFVTDNLDCDDARSDDHPGAVEVCDNHDNDCDGYIDAGAVDATLWYADLDADTFGDASAAVDACVQPPGYVGDDTDCDDIDPTAFPGGIEVCDGVDNDCNDVIDDDLAMTWYADTDGDGHGDALSPLETCGATTGYVSSSDDCDDTDDTAFPGAIEACDGVDNNCDTAVDEGVQSTFYADSDGDSYGDAAVPTLACSATPGWVANSTDCDDGESSINPAAADVCDGLDNDCTNVADDDATFQTTWYTDSDGDSFGDAGAPEPACDAPPSTVTNSDDCDDAHSAAHPGGTEVCDDLDNDCNTLIDDGATDLHTFYLDGDSDGYGSGTSTEACSTPSGYAATSTDCDDAVFAINPGAAEVCDDLDNNCDTVIDTDAVDRPTWYEDTDGDLFGSTVSQIMCDQPAGYVATPGDCDDGAVAMNPDASEICDGVDNDCNTLVDDSPIDGATWYLDFDNDTYGGATSITACSASAGYVATSTDCDDTDSNSHPGGTETCDGADNDCNTLVDDSATDADTWYYDFDADSYGDADLPTLSCDQPVSYVLDDTDCDDGAFTVNPAASETCNGVDDDCDLSIDEPGSSGEATWYLDSDGDGYGGATSEFSCDAPPSYVSTGDDCDDADATAYPGATEVCEDGSDNDCDADPTDCLYADQAALELLAVSPTGLIMYGGQTLDRFGSAVAGGADVGGDSGIDVAISATGWDSGGGSNNYGRTYIWNTLSATDTVATAPVVYSGSENGEAFGSSVAFVGDFTADGKGEILVGAWRRDGSTGVDSGGAYLFKGDSSSGYTTSAFATITGSSANQGAGYVVLGADLDGAGDGDLVVTAPSNVSTAVDAGSVNVWYDGIAAGTTTIAAAELILTGKTIGDLFGSAASTGDVDADGVDDLLVGALGVDSGSSVDAGAAYFVFGDGSTGSRAADASDVVFANTGALERVGIAVSMLGDINGDGYGDVGVAGDRIAVGIYAEAGQVYIFDGGSIADGTITGSVSPSAVATTYLSGENLADNFGNTLSAAGDVDADGHADFLVSAPGYDLGSTPNAGAIYLEYGTTSFTPMISSRWLGTDSDNGTATADIPRPFALGGLGDIDADGYDDVGASGGLVEHGMVGDAGAAWILYGSGY